MILRRKRQRHKYLVLALFLALSGSVALFGTLFSPGEWYAQISKPPWTPPPALFGPVWTVLHVLMAVAAWQVWRHHLHHLRWPALAAFIVQLGLNAAWSWTFFGAHQIGWAAANLAALWVMLAVTVALFFRVTSTAGALMVPYLVWASFALALNFEIWQLN